MELHRVEEDRLLRPVHLGAQRLPNGDTLICSGTNGTIFEVTPKDEIAGDRAVVLEDVVTTGGQALRAARVSEAAGARVSLILAVVDRHEGGREGIVSAGYGFDALFDITEWPIDGAPRAGSPASRPS